METTDGNAEHKRVIDLLAVPRSLEPNPSERKRKCDRRSENASPRQKPMRCPTRVRAAIDESLQDYVVPNNARQVPEIGRELFRRQEYLPPSEPVHAGRRP